MKSKKPIAVERENIVVGNQYYTCGYTGVAKVTVIRIFPKENKVLVKVKSDKCRPFIRKMEYIFDDPRKAKGAGRKWKDSQRKKKRKKK